MGAELEYREIERVLEQIVGKNVGFEELVNEVVQEMFDGCYGRIPPISWKIVSSKVPL